MTCTECRAGWHLICSSPSPEGDGDCCCGGRFDLLDAARVLELEDALHAGKLVGAETVGGAQYALEMGHEPKKASGRGSQPAQPAATQDSDPTSDQAATAGDSGYIHPDAWASTAVIGTLTDPSSTGRKRVDRMYKIRPGQVCEWARMKDCGGGPKPIVGCIGNPASDLHHGPDKNTLNNAKVSRGIGTAENVHAICSDCHNRWHSVNDPFYGPYDRVAQQAEPWLPYSDEPWGSQTPSPATPEELWEQEKERERQREERGRAQRGRNAAGKLGDVTVQPDE